MEVAALRERLHEYIDTADEQHLSAIYTLGDNASSSDNGPYDQETMDMLYERRESHRNGTSRSYSAEEAMELIRKSKK